MNGNNSSGKETQFSKSRFAILEKLHKLRNWIKLLFLPNVAKRSSAPKLSFIIERDVINHESEETINDAILIINQLKGKTPYEIERICLTIKKLVHGNAKL